MFSQGGADHSLHPIPTAPMWPGQGRLSGKGWSSLCESSEYCCTTFFLALCFYLSFPQKESKLLSALWTTLPHKGSCAVFRLAPGSLHTVLVAGSYSCSITFTSLTCTHGHGRFCRLLPLHRPSVEGSESTVQT